MDSKQKSRALRNNMTDAERHLWYYLRRRHISGYKFRRQFPLGNYIVDFICLEKRLIIEVDGGQHAEQIQYDKSRDSWLNEQGFQLLRFWNSEVLGETEAVLAKIWQVVTSS
jgi:very-short-patch-repair endonuclease